MRGQGPEEGGREGMEVGKQNGGGGTGLLIVDARVSGGEDVVH